MNPKPLLFSVALVAVIAAGSFALLMRDGDTRPEAMQSNEISVPSGQDITLMEVINNERGPTGLAVRYRFLAPAISRDGGKVDFDSAAADMQHLCDSYVIPRLANTGPQPSQIIVSISDRKVPFATPSPEATQYFEAYRIENGRCIWEAF